MTKKEICLSHETIATYSICDDDLMKLWYDCWDTIVPIYDKWQEKLEEMKEPEEDE